MTHAERRDLLAGRLSALSAALFVTDAADTPITGWTLDELSHHISQGERLVGRLNGQAPTEGGPF